MANEKGQLDIKRFTVFNTVFNVAEYVILYPNELVKTRLQVHMQPSPSFARTYFKEVVDIYKTARIKGFYHGFTTFNVFQAPIQFVFLGSYIYTKKSLFKIYNRFHHLQAQGKARYWWLPKKDSILDQAIPGIIPAFSGGFAEIVSLLLWVPQDLITQNIQVDTNLNRKRPGTYHMAQVYKKDGFWGFYRGIKPSLLTYVPASAIWWGSYEFAKQTFFPSTGSQETNSSPSPYSPPIPIVEAHQVFFCPNLALNRVDRYPETQPKEESLFLTLEDLEEDREELSFSNLVCGAFAGVMMSTLTNPFDIAKTRIQTQIGNYTPKSTNTFKLLFKIVQQEGFASLHRGLFARILLTAPQSAVAAITYELIIMLSIRS